MLSTELRQRVSAIVEKYRQHELDFLEMLGRIDNAKQSKPRIRVKAISQRRVLPEISQIKVGGE